MNRYALRDDQWERVKDLLPGKPGDVGVTAHDNRRFGEAVLYRYRTGIPWRDLPERFGDWKNTHRRFSRWAKKGQVSQLRQNAPHRAAAAGPSRCVRRGVPPRKTDFGPEKWLVWAGSSRRPPTAARFR